MAFFDKIAPLYDSGMKLLGLYKHKTIERYLKPVKDDMILDIGGGTGFIANKLSANAKRVIVVDISEKMLKKAARYNNIETCLTDALNMPFGDNSFDAIYCTDAMHHIKKHEELIKEINRLLKPNGRVVIIDFKTTGILGKLLKWIELTFIDDSKFVEPDELTRLMAKYDINGKSISISRMEFMFSGKKKDH